MTPELQRWLLRPRRVEIPLRYQESQRGRYLQTEFVVNGVAYPEILDLEMLLNVSDYREAVEHSVGRWIGKLLARTIGGGR